MSLLVFIESNTTGTGALHLSAARKLGFEVALICSTPDRYPFAAEHEAKVIQINTDDFDVVRRTFNGLRKSFHVSGVLSTSDHFIESAARLSQEFELPGPDPYAIRNCRDKWIQRQLLEKLGLPTPRFWKVESEEDLRVASGEIILPVIVKPRIGTGSIGVKLCSTMKEIADHTHALLSKKENERGGARPPSILIEQYLDGAEYSAELFFGKLLGITRKHLSHPPYFVEIGHDFPADLPQPLAAAVQRAMTSALAACGLTWGHCHVEFRIIGDQVVIIEINPRLAGGHIPTIVHLATDVDPIELSIRAYTGLPTGYELNHTAASSIRFMTLPRSGAFLRIDGTAKALAVTGVVEIQCYKKPGADLEIQHDFRDRVGHVIAAGETGEEAAWTADSAIRHLRVVMDSPGSTGRIRRPLNRQISAVLFEQSYPQQVETDLPFIAEVDRAHVVMLAEEGLIDQPKAASLLREIEHLCSENFRPLQNLSVPRGLFLAYESYLIRKLGAEVGGLLQTARSRNDLSATVFRMKLRQSWLGLVTGLTSLQRSLLKQAAKYREYIMPIYTHGQAGVPGTLGHYFLGIACALNEDIASLIRCSEEIDHCPLGACAAGGTTFPIDCQRTAALLGFKAPVDHSILAVASRDIALRLLSAATIFGVHISRVATDLLQWSTTEFGFFAIPDELAGSSSAMPQKRNPFVLEHIIGMSAAPLGTFVQASAAMRSAPYTNSIQVGTEAIRNLSSALKNTEDAATLLRLMIDGLVPNRTNMSTRAKTGFTTAIEWANQLVRREGLDFRSAHHQVGEWINQLERGEDFANPPRHLRRSWPMLPMGAVRHQRHWTDYSQNCAAPRFNIC